MSTEEQKQMIIARQSSLNRAIEYCQMNNINVNLSELTGISETLTNYVLNGKTDTVKNNLKTIDNYFKEKKV